MTYRIRTTLLLATAGLALAGCGGSGGGPRLVSTPPPGIAPTPTPAAGPLETAPFGVTATTNFATIGSDVSIRWNAELAAYEVTVPGIGQGRVLPSQPGSPFGSVIATDGSALPLNVFVRPVGNVWAPFAHTSWAEIRITGSETSQVRHVAYGLATPAGGVPTIGQATYAAEINGTASGPSGGYSLYGSATFLFNFAAGTLSGHMDPKTNGPMGGPDLPRYTFQDTVYSTGSTTFSGKFDITGPTQSSLQGRFTGPGAQELMARFNAPFVDTWADGPEPGWGTLEGVMIGKRN